MNSDDDEYYTGSQSARRAKTYLDFVEFCRAEFEESLLASDQPVSKQQRSNSNDRLIRYREKIADSRIVDFDVLIKYQIQSQTDFSEIQELLLYLDQIDRLNKNTSYLPLNKLFKHVGSPGSYHFDLLNTKKKLIVDTSVYKVLKKNRQINWSSTLNKLYPIKTIGDGNCLCHAVLSYLVGFQDVNLVLREALKTYMSDLDCNKALKKRWLRYRQICDAGNNIQTEEKQLDQEWTEIISLKSSEKNADKENERAKESTRTATLSLVFLEDIHIFALANLFKRPIIILSLELYKNIQPIQLRGIYLPLLNKPEACFKEPIVIAFHNFHFMPLLFALDEQEALAGLTTLNEKQFHFTNVDKIDSDKLSTIDYEYKNNYEAEMRKASDISVNKMATRQLKVKKLSNYLPIHYHNLERMEVHFLEQEEDKIESELLNKYLNLKRLVLEVDEAEPDQLPYLNNQREVELLCCSLVNERKTATGDGISTYIDFLNESIFKNSSSISSSNGVRTTTEFSPINATPVSTTDLYPTKTSPLKYVSNVSKLCAVITCPNDALDPNRPEYRGLCKSCYRKLIQMQNDEAESQQAAENNKRLTRSYASKENEYQGPSNQYYYTEPAVQSKVTLISDNQARCRGNNCSQMAADGDYYCKSCRIVRQKLNSQQTPAPAPEPTQYRSSNQREIPIQIQTSSGSNYPSSSSSNNFSNGSRTYQIPITRLKEPLGSSTMTNQSKLYNGNLTMNPRTPVNLNSAYNIYDQNPTSPYESTLRSSRPASLTCTVCTTPISYQEYINRAGRCTICFVRDF